MPEIWHRRNRKNIYKPGKKYLQCIFLLLFRLQETIFQQYEKLHRLAKKPKLKIHLVTNV